MIFTTSVHTERYFSVDGFFMKSLLKRVVIITLLIGMMWFGSIIADKECLRDEVMHLHILSQQGVPISIEITSTMQSVVSSFLQDVSAVTSVNNNEKMLFSSQLAALEQKISSIFEERNMHHSISVKLKNTENTEQEYDGFCVPAGVFRTIEIHVGDVREGANQDVAILNCIIQEENIRSIFLKKHSLRYSVLNYLGILENIFFLG